MGVNRVIYGNTPIMDISDTTAEAQDVSDGKVFYGKDGVRRTGTGSGGTAEVFQASYGTTSASELQTAIDAGLVIVIAQNGNERTISFAEYVDDTVYLHCYESLSGNASLQGIGTLYTVTGTTWETVSTTFASYDELPGVATENVSGTIKLNPAQSITKNADGQLVVGGRMGQFSGTTGLFAPNNRDPRNVGDYSLLMTDALGMDMPANRAMAIVSGYGITCQSAPAGSTSYNISNTYANRIIAKCCEGGYASLNEAESTVKRIVKVNSVTINGASFTPDSSADSSTPIVITVAETLNPNSATTSIRLFGKMTAYATAHFGNGVASGGGGRNLLIGGGVTKAGQPNDNCLVGNGIYSSGNGNACFGRWHIASKNRGLLAGSGHDTRNAKSEGVSAVGVFSLIDGNTLFAVGNGTSATSRSNAFEVVDGGFVLKSPNGTRYKITVADDGTVSSTAL